MEIPQEERELLDAILPKSRAIMKITTQELIGKKDNEIVTMAKNEVLRLLIIDKTLF